MSFIKFAGCNNGYKPILERFEKKFEKTEGCWEWKGSKNLKGYGQLSKTGGGSPHTASRLSWELYRGEIPDGLCVLHTCDNAACVNPSHLFLGTVKDNNQDRHDKGRSRGNTTNTARGDQLPQTFLTDKQVLEIISSPWGQTYLARFYKVSQGHISNIKHFKDARAKRLSNKE